MIEVDFAGKTHPIYSLEEARELGISINADWRLSRVGEWVLSDTGYVLEVLADGYAGQTKWVRTCCGTYVAAPSVSMGHEPRKDRYTFSGGDRKYSITDHVRQFIRVYVRTGDPILSYRLAFPRAKSQEYIRQRSSRLLNKPQVQTEISNELDRIFDALKIDREWSIKEIKEMSDELKGRTGKKELEAKSLRFKILCYLEKKMQEAKSGRTGKGRITEEVTFNLNAAETEAFNQGKAVNRSPDKHIVKMVKRVEDEVELDGGLREDHISGGDQGSGSD